MSVTIGPTGSHAAAPVPETPLQLAVENAVEAIEVAAIAAQPHASAAVIDGVFVQHLNTLPVACETAMRPLIEAARRDLKAKLAAV